MKNLMKKRAEAFVEKLWEMGQVTDIRVDLNYRAKSMSRLKSKN